MRIRAVVWEVDAQGAVLVFVNLDVHDFTRLRSYVDSLLVHRSSSSGSSREQGNQLAD
jgi:hypothetical protein